MANTGLDLPTQDLIRSFESRPKALPGFIKSVASRSAQGQMAKALASAFLKYTAEGQRYSKEDSVQSFIALSQLHRELTEEVQRFLLDEVPFVYEDQQLQPLLLNFALYRLNQISRRYYYAVLQNQPQAVLKDLKAVIQQRQAEYDTLFQQI